MGHKHHHYQLMLEWKGNLGAGTRDYKSYAREFNIYGVADKKLHGSADPAFLGKENYWNPEELLLASLSLPVISYGIYTFAQRLACASSAIPIGLRRQWMNCQGNLFQPS